MTINRARRTFLGTVAAGGVSLVTSQSGQAASQGASQGAVTRVPAPTGKPAVLGGTPVRTAAFPSWPVQDAREEQALVSVLKSGRWGRGGGSQVKAFESAYATATGARHCLATANGTSALLTVLAAMDIGAGDEVIVPPYTFVATVNAVLALNALPVFVDTDIETFQIDATKIAAAITPQTRLILPVHLGGSVADMDTILATAGPRNIAVIEDACQSHLAQWKGRHVGTVGRAGCFSFQASKNLNSGEGGAIITSDRALADRAFAFHNNGRGDAGTDFSYRHTGLNLRLTEFQAALLLAQMTRLEAQATRRETNAAYLTKGLLQIPGITPARMYPGVTRNAYHLYMFRYDAASFGGLTRAGFLKALKAEGVPASGGYSPLNKEPFLAATFAGTAYQRIYGAPAMKAWEERTRTPQNDRLCEQAVWLTQTMLLGPREDMDHVIEAVARIQRHAGEIARQSND
ncbi:DegT/DnrJ/EryC1/StrS family aminotransferase [Luteitalea sp.]|jgi:dTDP-4-amino-4,6-dideoxygalactose transaminase|uniref:DegT/DnrJ/EryC1/StrS family aminotransferase n=1 Tax=Luteitalea sp. TaxID=2004800 RepID=UPI0037C7E958